MRGGGRRRTVLEHRERVDEAATVFDRAGLGVVVQRVVEVLVVPRDREHVADAQPQRGEQDDAERAREAATVGGDHRGGA